MATIAAAVTPWRLALGDFKVTESKGFLLEGQKSGTEGEKVLRRMSNLTVFPFMVASLRVTWRHSVSWCRLETKYYRFCGGYSFNGKKVSVFWQVRFVNFTVRFLRSVVLLR